MNREKPNLKNEQRKKNIKFSSSPIEKGIREKRAKDLNSLFATLKKENSQMNIWKEAPSHQSFVIPSLSHVQLFVTPKTAAHWASLSITISQSLLKLMSIESLMPSNHLIFCCPLLLLPSVFPSIRVSLDELALHIRWPKYWSFSFNISPSNEYLGRFLLGLTGFISFCLISISS